MRGVYSLWLIWGALLSILSGSMEMLFTVNVIGLSIYLLISILLSRFVRLYHTWIVSFIYIIIPEAMHYVDSLPESNEIFMATKFICLANWVLLLGHRLKYSEGQKKIAIHEIGYRAHLSTVIMILLLYILFLYGAVPRALQIFRYGRVNLTGNATPVFLSGFMQSIGLVLPAILSFVVRYVWNRRRYWLYSIALSMPVLILLFMGGTRFPLLFSASGLFIVLLAGKRLAFRQMVIGAVACLILITLAEGMKAFRTFGAQEGLFRLLIQEKESERILIGSNESVIDQTSLMMDFFRDHEHLRGMSSAYLLYFWIPRKVWPDKPTMLGYWLFRETRGSKGFSKGHSYSLGFTGETYADFGYLGAVFSSFLLGLLLAHLDLFVKHKVDVGHTTGLILAATCYGYAFFFVRSPLTASFNMIGVICVYFVFRMSIDKVRYYRELETQFPK